MAEKEEEEEKVERDKGVKEEEKDGRKRVGGKDEKKVEGKKGEKADEEKKKSEEYYGYYGGYPFDNREYGRDTNRLDYFRVAPFDVYGDNHLAGSRFASYGGGGGSRDRGRVLVPTQVQERDSSTSSHSHVGGHDQRTRQFPDGGEPVVYRWEQERGYDSGGAGRRRPPLVTGPRLEPERGSAIPRASGGGYWTQEAPVEILSNNGSHNSGEAVVQRLNKHEGVRVPMAVAVAWG